MDSGQARRWRRRKGREKRGNKRRCCERMKGNEGSRKRGEDAAQSRWKPPRWPRRLLGSTFWSLLASAMLVLWSLCKVPLEATLRTRQPSWIKSRQLFEPKWKRINFISVAIASKKVMLLPQIKIRGVFLLHMSTFLQHYSFINVSIRSVDTTGVSAIRAPNTLHLTHVMDTEPRLLSESMNPPTDFYPGWCAFWLAALRGKMSWWQNIYLQSRDFCQLLCFILLYFSFCRIF